MKDAAVKVRQQNKDIQNGRKRLVMSFAVYNFNLLVTYILNFFYLFNLSLARSV